MSEMPSLQRKRKAYNKKYYEQSKLSVESQACASRREYNKEYYVQNAQRLRNKARVHYQQHCNKKRLLPGPSIMLLLRKRRLVLEPCINITLVELGLHFVFIMKKILLYTRISSFRKYHVSHKRDLPNSES